MPSVEHDVPAGDLKLKVGDHTIRKALRSWRFEIKLNGVIPPVKLDVSGDLKLKVGDHTRRKTRVLEDLKLKV